MISSFPTLYLNENVSIRLLPELEKRSLRAVHTITIGNRRFTDEQQLIYASKNNYILVTHNRNHFKKLHLGWKNRGLKHSGILLVKFDEADVLAERIEDFFINIYAHVGLGFCLSPPVLSDNREQE